mgnify:CR=1 FL=1
MVGCRSLRCARKVFYPGVCGLVLVHDLSNRKSEEGLEAWATEVREGRKAAGMAMEAVVAKSPSSVPSPQGRVWASEDEAELATLLVGTRADADQGRPAVHLSSRSARAPRPACRWPSSWTGPWPSSADGLRGWALSPPPATLPFPLLPMSHADFPTDAHSTHHCSFEKD